MRCAGHSSQGPRPARTAAKFVADVTAEVTGVGALERAEPWSIRCTPWTSSASCRVPRRPLLAGVRDSRQANTDDFVQEQLPRNASHSRCPKRTANR